MNSLRCLAAALVLLAALGCGSGGPPPPTTYPVSGKVLLKGGGPMKAGLVEFRSVTDPLLITRGELKPDGTFSLVTVRDRKQFPGAVAGSHEVTIHPPQNQDQSAIPITLPRRYEVKAQENQFEFVVDASAR